MVRAAVVAAVVAAVIVIIVIVLCQIASSIVALICRTLFEQSNGLKNKDEKIFNHF